MHLPAIVAGNYITYPVDHVPILHPPTIYVFTATLSPNLPRILHPSPSTLIVQSARASNLAGRRRLLIASMRSALLLLAALGSFVAASPVRFGSPNNFPNYKSLVPKHSSDPLPSSCVMSNAVPPTAPTPLPPPSTGLSLYFVAIGRGIQNYTCADSTASSIPVAIGAIATLYNATCIAASYPVVFSTLPGIALKVPLSSIPDSLVASGYHYFTNSTTPTFDLGDLGFVHAKKIATSTAPTSTPSAVAWLKLQAEAQGEVGGIQEIYRLNTAGGTPPANCSGMASAFEVQYAAEYWFWGASGA